MKAFIKSHRFGLVLLFAIFIAVMIVRLSGGCPIYRIFHIECLSCGLFHACLAALRFDFNKAFSSHPMFWSVPILALYVVFEGKPFKKKWLNIVVISVIVAGFIINYIMKYRGVILSYLWL